MLINYGLLIIYFLGIFVLEQVNPTYIFTINKLFIKYKTNMERQKCFYHFTNTEDKLKTYNMRTFNGLFSKFSDEKQCC